MKAVMTSASVMLGIEFLILKKTSNVAMEELGQLLVDAIRIMLGVRSSTCSHIIVGEDFFKLFLGSDGVRGKACEPVHDGWHEHDGKIVCHDTGRARTAVA